MIGLNKAIDDLRCGVLIQIITEHSHFGENVKLRVVGFKKTSVVLTVIHVTDQLSTKHFNRYWVQSLIPFQTDRPNGIDHYGVGIFRTG